jgi:hypothetical protein
VEEAVKTVYDIKKMNYKNKGWDYEKMNILKYKTKKRLFAAFLLIITILTGCGHDKTTDDVIFESGTNKVETETDSKAASHADRKIKQMRRLKIRTIAKLQSQ